MKRIHVYQSIFSILLLLLFLSYALGSENRINSFLTSIRALALTTEVPVANFSFTPDNVCANTPIKFTNTSIGTDLTYEWDFGDGGKSTAKDPSHTFSTATGGDTRTFTVTLTVNEGTESTVVQKTVTVKEIPSLNVNSDAGSADFENLKYFIVCENEASEFAFYNAAGSTEKNMLYQIDWGDGSPLFSGPTWTELKHTYAEGIYSITYSVTPENGCKVSKKYGVFIGSNPAVGLGNPGNTNVCVGETLTFPITGAENNPEGTKYTVTFSDGSAPQVFTHPAPASVSHTFTSTSCGSFADGLQNSFSVKIVAQNPCAISQATVVPIYVSEPALPVIAAPLEPVCVDTDITIGNETDFQTEVSTNGSCSQDGNFIWEISPSTGWTLQQGSSLGSRPNPNAPNSWNSGSTNIVPKFSTPGTYTVKLITGNRCGIKEVVRTICVIPKPEPSFTLEETQVCGPAIVKATNTSNDMGVCGTGTMTTAWTVSYSRGTCGTSSNWEFTGGSDQNSESPTFLFTNPGIYTIRLTIDSSCGRVSTEEKVTVLAPPTVSIDPIPDSCGPVIVTPKASITTCESDTPTYKWTFEGGVPATSTSLDPGPVTFSTPGPKSITLEVSSSCGATIAEKTFIVSEIPTANAGADDEICNGEEIQLNGTIDGGTGPFTYAWTSIPASSISDGNTASPTVKPTQTTTYTLNIIDSKGCKTTDEIEIKVIPAPIIQFDLPDQEICSGELTQEVILSSNPSGENITWTSAANGVGGVSEGGTSMIPVQTLVNTTGKPIDVIYTALIASSTQESCTVVPAEYTIRVNPEPTYTDDNLSICSDQSFDYTPSDATIGSTFIWSVVSPPGITGATNSTQRATSIMQQLSNTSTAPLTAIYTVTPFLGACPGDDFELQVTVQPAPSIVFSEPDQTLCTGSSSQSVLFSSDVAGASFSWTANGNGVAGVIPSGTGSELPQQLLTNTTSRPITVEYQISVLTNTGGRCSGIPGIYRITVNPSLTLAEQISDYNGFQISCSGADDGFITLDPSGGNGVYAYSWTGPGGFTSSSKNISNLAPGSYQVTIADEFGCSISKSYQLTEPQPLLASVVSTTDILCAGDESGAIAISVSGGVSSPPYQFEWSRNGVQLPVNIQNISGIPAGTYEVKISDANGCFEILSGIQVTEPAVALLIDFTKTDISCYGANDGSLDLDVRGGLPPYTIDWTFGSGQSSFDNLGPGDYTLTVADQSGCSRTQTITIKDAPLFKTEPEIQHITCFGENNGSIQLNLEGGVGRTAIRWDHGAELENLFNLSAGFYGVTIKDETACEIRSEFNIVEPAILKLESSISDALDCVNPLSGGIDLAISGGTPPYLIKWSNGQITEDLTEIPAGQYAVAVVDAAGCTVNGTFDIKRPPGLAITAFRSFNIECEPRMIEEEIKITVSGGIAPYTIQWSGGTVSTDLRTMTTRTPGFYEVVVTDGKGCMTRQSFQVENFDLIAETEIESAGFEQYNAFLVNFEIQFINKSFGEISSYYWNFGDGSESFEENPKHTYSAEGEYEIVLTVTDIFGCSVQVKKKISVLDYYLVMPNVFTPNGDGVNDYFFPKFIKIESVEFWVLNKWGETIFYTDDLNSPGWDGQINQELAMPGNYVYKVKFSTLDGRTQTRTDLFLLLK